MASSDKIWFDTDIRDNITKVLTDILSLSDEIQDRMDSFKIKSDAVSNAAELERALSKISVAQDRISEAKLVATDKKQLDDLKNMDKELGKIISKIDGLSNLKNLSQNIVNNPTQKNIDKFNEALIRFGTKGWAKFVEEEENLSLALEQVKRKTGEIIAQSEVDARNKEREARNIDTLQAKYYELARIRKSLQDAILNAAPGTDLQDYVSTLNSVTGKMGAIRKAQGKGVVPSSLSDSDYDEWLRNVRDKTKELTAATSDYNNKLKANEDIQKGLNRIQEDTESQKRIAGIRRQTIEYNALQRKLTDIKNLKTLIQLDEQTIKAGGKPTVTRDYINSSLEAIQRRYNEELARGKQLEKDDADAKNRKAEASKKAADAVQLLAHINQGLVSSYTRIAEEGSRAGRITVQLQNQIAGYAGLYGMERLVKSIITIGGQFEFQHVALQNILGDLQQANVLFGQLQTMAVESPKTFMELTSYTKQLSAYQIPYEELFETTKRLADMSTGLGVDMSRLILAYGQVRSASVLRGQELRQFTEAGIPLVQALADKFTELNGKAVTTAEVFELISKRAVPFEMVKEILWDMTDEGGQFYNMQAELADTLYGKWQKLQDQWQITLGNIADGENLMGGTLRFLLEGLVKAVSLLEKITPLLSTIMLAKVGKSMKGLFTSFYDARVGLKEINNMKLAKMQQANALQREQILYGRQLDKQELELINSKNRLLANELKLLLAEGKITEYQMFQLANAKKLERIEVMRVMHARGYTAQQIMQMRNGDLTMLQGYKTRPQKFKDGFSGLVGGKWGAAAMGLGAYLSLYSNYREKENQGNDMATSASKSLLEDLDKVNSTYNEFTKKAPSKTEEINNAIQRMTNELKECGRYTDSLQESLNKTDSITGKYTLLYNELHKVSDEYLRMKDNVEAYLKAANNAGGGNFITGLFKDPISKDIEELSASNIEKNKERNNLTKRYSALLKSTIKEFMADEGLWKRGDDRRTWEELFDSLGSEQKTDYKLSVQRRATVGPLGLFIRDEDKIYGEAANAIDDYIKALNTAKSDREEVMGQMEDYLFYINEAIKSRAQLSNISLTDASKWSDKDARNVNSWINEIIGSYHVDAETQEFLKENIIKSFPNPVEVRLKALPVLDRSVLAPWQEDLDKYFKEHEMSNLVRIDAKVTMEDVEKDMQNEYKNLKAQADRYGKILIKFGIDTSSLPASFEEIKDSVPFWMRDFAEKAFSGYKESDRDIKKLEQAETDTGIDVRGKKKQKTRGSGTDKAAKQLREYIRILKEAESAYQHWRKTVGDESAADRANMEFGDEVKRVGKAVGMPDLKFENEEQYEETLEKIREKYDRIYKASKGKRPQLLEAIKELDKVLADISRKNFEKQMEEYSSKVQTELSNMTKAWDVYNKTVSDTGNRKLAASLFKQIYDLEDMGGEITPEFIANYTFDENSTLPDLLQKKIDHDLESISREFNIGEIKLDYSIDMSEKDIENMVKDAFNISKPVAPVRIEGESNKDFEARQKDYEKTLSSYQSRIQGVIKSVKKLDEATKKQLQNELDGFVKVLSSLNSYDAQLEKIRTERDNKVAANDNLADNGVITRTQATEANRIINIEYDEKVWKLSNDYINLMNNSLILTKNEIENGIVRAQDILNQKLAAGLISAQEYAEQMEKIRDIQEGWNQNSLFGKSNSLTSFLTGGSSGLRNFLKQQIKAADQAIASESKKGTKVNPFAIAQAKEQKSDAEGGLKGLDTVEGLSKAFGALANTLQPVIDLFDKLGMKGVGQVVGGVQSALGGAANGAMAGIALGGAAGGPWGAAIGAGLSLANTAIGAIAGDVDSALEEEIAASEQRVREMNQLKNMIETAFEKSLGGLVGYANSEIGKENQAKFEARTKKYVDIQKKRIEAENKVAENKAEQEAFSNDITAQAKAVFDQMNNSQNNPGGSILDAFNTNTSSGILSGVSEDMANTLGDGILDVLTAKSASWVRDETVEAINKANQTGLYYDQEKALKMAEYDELQHQIDSENGKKDSDDAAIAEWQSRQAELKEELRTFAVDFAKELYGIDLKSWASELTDAIVTAWENGEDAAEAYSKNVKSIMKNLAKTLLQQKIMEQVFKKSGIEELITNMIDSQSGDLNFGNISQIADRLQEAGGKAAEMMTAILDELYARGTIDKDSDSSSSLSNSIKGITEQTADLLAAYVNSIRADVSVNRQTLFSILTHLQAQSGLPAVAQAQLQQLQTLVSLAQERNRAVSEIQGILHSSQAGIKPLRTTV